MAPAKRKERGGGGRTRLVRTVTAAIVQKKFQCAPYSPICSWNGVIAIDLALGYLVHKPVP